jgi:hypothetical protein
MSLRTRYPTTRLHAGRWCVLPFSAYTNPPDRTTTHHPGHWYSPLNAYTNPPHQTTTHHPGHWYSPLLNTYTNQAHPWWGP